MTEPLLRCHAVEAGYDGVTVLFGVDLEVRPGEIVALLGTNGAGKSTLLRAISGTIGVTAGAITFDGADITHADANHTAAAGIAHVSGGRAIFPTLSVREHLRLAAWLEKDDTDHVSAATERALDTFPVLRDRIDQHAGDLSGGEQQMLAIGMALIARPTLLIIDELSLGLAPTIVARLLDVVREIRDAGVAVLLVEQSLNVAMTVADRAYFLEKGEVRFEGDVADLAERDDIVRSVFFARADHAEAPSAPRTTNGHARRARALLEIRDLRKSFGGVRATDDAEFTLLPGEILGLIGANGAGKTTLFDLISGFLAPDAGSVVYERYDMTSDAPHVRARHGLGRAFQDARLVPSLSVHDNLKVALDRHLPLRDHVADALALPGLAQLEREVDDEADRLIGLLGLEDHRDSLVRELSTGTRRVVDLAMLVAHRPKVLLLDEPSSGIAQREAEALGPLLRRIRDEIGCAMLVIDHDIPLLRSICDRMVALELGHPIAAGTPDEVLDDPDVIASYLGGDPATISRSG